MVAEPSARGLAPRGAVSAPNAGPRPRWRHAPEPAQRSPRRRCARTPCSQSGSDRPSSTTRRPNRARSISRSDSQHHWPSKRTRIIRSTSQRPALGAVSPSGCRPFAGCFPVPHARPPWSWRNSSVSPSIGHHGKRLQPLRRNMSMAERRISQQSSIECNSSPKHVGNKSDSAGPDSIYLNMNASRFFGILVKMLHKQLEQAAYATSSGCTISLPDFKFKGDGTLEYSLFVARPGTER